MRSVSISMAIALVLMPTAVMAAAPYRPRSATQPTQPVLASKQSKNPAALMPGGGPTRLRAWSRLLGIHKSGAARAERHGAPTEAHDTVHAGELSEDSPGGWGRVATKGRARVTMQERETGEWERSFDVAEKARRDGEGRPAEGTHGGRVVESAQQIRAEAERVASDAVRAYFEIDGSYSEYWSGYADAAVENAVWNPVGKAAIGGLRYGDRVRRYLQMRRQMVPDNAARLAELKQILVRTPEGRRAIAKMTELDIEVFVLPTGNTVLEANEAGGTITGVDAIMLADAPLPSMATTFVHEAMHIEKAKERREPAKATDGRNAIKNEGLDEEAAATVAGARAARSFRREARRNGWSEPMLNGGEKLYRAVYRFVIGEGFRARRAGQAGPASQ
jgi:hypothetical protein